MRTAAVGNRHGSARVTDQQNRGNDASTSDYA
jgi:hypothetical protein